jgi:DnaK suppressor protein
VVLKAPENTSGRVSRKDAINNRSVVEASLRQAVEKLNKLKFALTKVDFEAFGVCRKCGNDIPVKRHMLVPQSLFCVNCAK